MQQMTTLPLDISSIHTAIKLNLQQPRRLLGVALVLGWSVDWLFYGKQVGISLVVFVTALVLSGIGLGWLEQKRPSLRNLWLILPLFFFAIMAFVRANLFLTTLNVLAVLALLTYLAFFYMKGHVHQLGVFGALLVPLRTGGHSVALTAPLLQESINLPIIKHHGQRNLLPILRGLLIALPILLVFGGLLISADLVFADYVDQVLKLQFLTHVSEWFWRICLVVGAAWLITGGLVYALVWRETAVDDKSALEEIVTAIPRHISLGFMETATVLALVDLLFFAFVAIQFAYLFGGERHLDLHGYTYSEYARRGFFELVVVAVLTLGLVLWLNWITRRENKRQLYLFNILSSSMILLVLVMLVSAWRRMHLYELAFGYTELRLQVYVFMVWLAVVLIWFLVTLWERPQWTFQFAIGLIVGAIGFLATLNLINPDAFIVRNNLVHYRETGELDAFYLTSLSDDAVPELQRVLSQVSADSQLVPMPGCRLDSTESDGYEEGACTTTLGQILTENLNGRYQARLNDKSWQQWQSFHLSRYRAFTVLTHWAADNETTKLQTGDKQS